VSTEPAPAPLYSPSPTAAKAQLRRRTELPDYLPARMLNEFVYCPRLFFYEWVEGVFAESGDTVEGSLRHETIRGRAEALPAAGEAQGEKIHARSVTLSSDRLKLIAIDLVEGTGGVVTPGDYKRGAPRTSDEGPEAWPADRAQVCAQAIRCSVSRWRATSSPPRFVISGRLCIATISSPPRRRWRSSSTWLTPRCGRARLRRC